MNALKISIEIMIRSFATHEYTRDIHKDYDKKSCNDQNKVALKISLINNYFVNLCLLESSLLGAFPPLLPEEPFPPLFLESDAALPPEPPCLAWLRVGIAAKTSSAGAITGPITPPSKPAVPISIEAFSSLL